MEIVSLALVALIIAILIGVNLKAVKETMNKKGRKPFIEVGEWTKIKTTELRVAKVEKQENNYIFYIEMYNKGKIPYEYNPVDFYFKGKNGMIKIDTYSDEVVSSIKVVKTLLKGDRLNAKLAFKTLDKDRPKMLMYTDFFIKREIKIRKRDIIRV